MPPGLPARPAPSPRRPSMSTLSPARTPRWRHLRAWIAALVGAAVIGCVQVRPPPRAPTPVPPEWQALLVELRAFTRGLGFKPTPNFEAVAHDLDAYPFCGHAPRFKLPWSYEDPLITWHESKTAEECRRASADIDVYYGATEALGEIATPVTASMIAAGLDRFIYLVVHEDCHDQFAFPQGIEEPLCELIAYRVMAAFGAARFRWYARERRVILDYATTQARLAHATIRYYDAIARVYDARRPGREGDAQALAARAPVFAQAEQTLGLAAGAMNNVLLANYMTYSRHFPVLERIYEALGGDIRRMIAFFREVDEAQPDPEVLFARLRLEPNDRVGQLRAQEEAILEVAITRLGGPLPPAPVERSPKPRPRS